MAESLIQQSECYEQQIEIEDLGHNYFQEFRNQKESQWPVATFESFQSIITLKIYTQIHPWERDPRFLGMQPSLLTDSWFYTLLVVSYILHNMICRYPIANFTTHDELEAMLKVKLNNPS